MAENSATEADTADTTEAPNNDSVNSKDVVAKPLQMSFADWKKTKEAKDQPAGSTTCNGRKPFKNENNNKQQQGNIRNQNNTNNNGFNNNQNNNNNTNSYPPLSRPPPMPFPLMSMGFNNFVSGPGPCGPSPMMPPGNMGNMGPGPNGRKHRPLQPPPFWEDMMSPQLRPPPIQPPMPKCPSLWNLVPKDKQKNNNKQNHQPNKKYKSSNNNRNSGNNDMLDSALMPPPPPPGGSDTSSNKSAANRVIKKKKCGGTFIQIDGKWIQRPEAPPPLEEAPPGTKEERQRQWKEYRQAMKPFKNREFHNYKRTVQRLSKIPREDLDEKQLERLQKAEEYIGAHKAMLTIKHAEQWVQQTGQKTEGTANASGQAIGPVQATGQVYVRKPVNTAWPKSNDPNTHRAPMRKQVFGTGRAIKGGLGSEMGVMPSMVGGAPASMGQYSNYFDPSSHQGFNSGPYGQDAATSNNNFNINNSNSFYSNYNTSFVKGGTLLPP